jgi:hypothetical protein
MPSQHHHPLKRLAIAAALQDVSFKGSEAQQAYLACSVCCLCGQGTPGAAAWLQVHPSPALVRPPTAVSSEPEAYYSASFYRAGPFELGPGPFHDAWRSAVESSGPRAGIAALAEAWCHGPCATQHAAAIELAKMTAEVRMPIQRMPAAAPAAETGAASTACSSSSSSALSPGPSSGTGALQPPGSAPRSSSVPANTFPSPQQQLPAGPAPAAAPRPQPMMMPTRSALQMLSSKSKIESSSSVSRPPLSPPPTHPHTPSPFAPHPPHNLTPSLPPWLYHPHTLLVTAFFFPPLQAEIEDLLGRASALEAMANSTRLLAQPVPPEEEDLPSTSGGKGGSNT